MLNKSALAGLRLDEITDQHAYALTAKFSSLSAPGINCGLRMLHRALTSGTDGKKLERLVKTSLAEVARIRC